MKQIFLVLPLALFTFGAQAQTAVNDSIEADSTIISLKEVSVEARTQYVDARKATYLVSKAQRNTSQSATYLLEQMAIPGLQIKDGLVSYPGFNNVKLFINSRRPAEGELNNLNMNNVVKVEVLKFPDDPRFENAEMAVNFIVREYQYGGYTRLSTVERMFNGFGSLNSAYSKFSYKRMTYSAFGRYSYSNTPDDGQDQTEIFNLKTSDGSTTDFTRRQSVDINDSKNIYRNPSAAFQATYEYGKTYIANQLSFAFAGSHKRLPGTTLTYSYDPDRDYTVHTNNDRNIRALNYDGTLITTLGQSGISLNVAPSFKYTSRSVNNLYATDIPNTSNIITNLREQGYDGGLKANLRKRFSGGHSGGLVLNGNAQHSHLVYSGTNISDNKFTRTQAVITPSYSLNTDKWYVKAEADLTYQWNTTDGKNTGKFLPCVNAMAQFSPSSAHQVGLWAIWRENAWAWYSSNPTIIQVDELMYIQGDINPSKKHSITLTPSYTWIPNNRFNLNVVVMYNNSIHQTVSIYTPYLDGRAVLKQYADAGNSRLLDANIRASYKIIPGRLNISGGLQHRNDWTTGYYSSSYQFTSFDTTLQFFKNNFSAAVNYEYGSAFFDNAICQLTKKPQTYSLQGNWGNGQWTCSLKLSNIFKKGYKGSTSQINSSSYTMRSTMYSAADHASLTASVSYTIGYGKKVNRWDDISSGASATESMQLK